jgi:hypothetical protein
VTLPKPHKATASHFYKYSSPDHLEWLQEILFNHDLYLPNLTELNDDNDGLPRLAMRSEAEMVSFIYRQFVTNNPTMSSEELRTNKLIIRFNVRKHGPAALHPHLVQSLDTQLKDFRVYSMTKRYDMTNLWALYAADHRGYCLEFENVGDLFKHAKDVSYLDSDRMEISIKDPALRGGYFLFCKTRNWSNEDEVRLVLPRNDGRSKVKFNPRWLTRIILGKDMSEDHKQQIREWAKQRKPELTVVTAYYDATKRAIRIKEQ